MSEPDYQRYRDRPDRSAAYGPYSLLGVTLGVGLMGVVTLAPAIGAVLGWALFVGPPLAGIALAGLGRRQWLRQLGVGLTASGVALGTALLIGLVGAIAGPG